MAGHRCACGIMQTPLLYYSLIRQETVSLRIYQHALEFLCPFHPWWMAPLLRHLSEIRAVPYDIQFCNSLQEDKKNKINICHSFKMKAVREGARVTSELSLSTAASRLNHL